MKKYLSLFFLLLIIFKNAEAQQNPLLSTLPSSETGVTFRNDIIETPEMFLYRYEYLYLGCGVAVGDINKDGLPDIYFSSTNGSCKLYLNLGNFKFKDITLSAGVATDKDIKTGVNMVDINNDGYLDIFVCKSGYQDPARRKKYLFINNGDLTFTNKIVEMGLDDRSYSIQSYFFDYDNDGDKDLYLLNHPIDFSRSMTIPATMLNGKLTYVNDTSNTKYVSDRLFENKGGKFTDVTVKSGLINHAFGLSTSIADVNRDGWPDIYVANDFNKPDQLYINNKNGTFTNQLDKYINHTSFSAMGSDITDINNDGLEDIFVMDMAVQNPVRQKQLFAVNQNYDKFQLLLKFGLYYQYPRNTLQLNNGDNTYSEVANFAGVAETEWSWGPLAVDFDNDGNKDFYIANGLKRDITDWDYKVFVLDSIMQAMNSGKNVDMNQWLNSMPSVPVQNYIYQNNGNLKFIDKSTSWSDAPPSFSSGAAYADFDNDGDLDMVVNNVDGEAFILRNNSEKNNNYLRCKLWADATKTVEQYGAEIEITDDQGILQVQHFDPQRGFLSTSEHIVHFGLGKSSVVKKLTVRFQNGTSIVKENVSVNQTLEFVMTDAVKTNTSLKTEPIYFAEATKEKTLPFTQKENDFIDFKREPLIPYKCSRKGPYFAKADVNADGIEDIFIGGSAGEAGVLMMGQASGQFISKSIADFTKDKAAEDMAAVFFDADGDGDVDLYVVSGGAEFAKSSKQYQDRLYINDGKGNFVRSATALPANFYNGSSVTVLDFDNDGDLDLFVGGHVLPGSFPKYDASMLLQNEAGIFTNVTTTIAPQLSTVGIVSNANWNDIDADGKNELIIVGEWAGPKIYSFAQATFISNDAKVIVQNAQGKDSSIAMTAFTGWWYNLIVEDIDADGKTDVVLANRGLNSSIKATVNTPCTIYAKDFDENGSYDAVLGYYNEGKLYPLFSRDQLIDQLPSMRKKFVRYKDYSGKTLDEIFTASEKQGMDVYETRFFESGVLKNVGNNVFRFIPFPTRAQFSNINDMLLQDVNNDGKKDLIICGNSEDPAVMVGVYDANAAMLLLNAGAGNFTTVLPMQSGFKLKGEVRKVIPLQNYEGVVFLRNNNTAVQFDLKK